MNVTSIKDKLQQTLQCEQSILQFYLELAERLGETDMGSTCLEAAAAAQNRVDQVSAWLNCMS